MDDGDWGFRDRNDAARYLGEVQRLWLAWLLGLAALVFTTGWLVVAAGVITVALLLFLARPLQERAAALVPEDTLVGGRFNVVGRGTARDRVLRALAYGRPPLEVATGLTGTGRWLLLGRLVVIAATVVGFFAVLFGTLPS